MKFKYIFLILILLLSLFCLSGCYDARGIETLAYAVALGIDKSSDDTIHLTLQFAVPTSSDSSSSSSQSSSSTIIDVDCSSIDSGISLINSYISKKVNLSHCKAIVISETLAYEGISDYIYTLVNNVEARPDCYVIISRCDAYYFLSNSTPTLESVPARYYELILNSNEYTGFTESIKLVDFYKSILSSTSQPVAILGGVNTKETQLTASEASTLDGSYKADQTPIETENSIENMGLAVFVQDKLVGELDNVETMCHMIVSSELENATVTVQNPYDHNSKISVYIHLSKDTKNNVKLVNGYPYVTCNVFVGGYVLSLEDTLNLSDQETLNTINETVSLYLENYINSYLYKTAKDFKSDIDDFGRYLLSSYLTLDEWNSADWLNNYQNSFFDVNVETNIVSGYLFSKF